VTVLNQTSQLCLSTTDQNQLVSATRARLASTSATMKIAPAPTIMRNDSRRCIQKLRRRSTPHA
jgi:hypothetical protein